MAKKHVSKEKVVADFQLLRSKYQSNQLHLKELQSKVLRTQKSISDLEKKIRQQEAKLKELRSKYPDFFSNQS